MDCTQDYLDTLRDAYQSLLTSGGVTRVRHGDRDTQWAPGNIKALAAEIARVERCLYRKQHGRNPPRLYRSQHAKGLR